MRRRKPGKFRRRTTKRMVFNPFTPFYPRWVSWLAQPPF